MYGAIQWPKSAHAIQNSVMIAPIDERLRAEDLPERLAADTGRAVQVEQGLGGRRPVHEDGHGVDVLVDAGHWAVESLTRGFSAAMMRSPISVAMK